MHQVPISASFLNLKKQTFEAKVHRRESPSPYVSTTTISLPFRPAFADFRSFADGICSASTRKRGRHHTAATPRRCSHSAHFVSCLRHSNFFKRRAGLMLFDAHPLSKAHARALLFSSSLIDLYKQKTSAAAAALQLNHVHGLEIVQLCRRLIWIDIRAMFLVAPHATVSFWAFILLPLDALSTIFLRFEM